MWPWATWKDGDTAMIRKLYPGGKPKAFSITYDDGVLQDIPLVSLLNRYGLKGTFNLNSGLMEEEFAWVHSSGAVIRRLPSHIAAQLYDGHEVASHTVSHPYMEHLSDEELMYQLGQDKAKLEQLFGREILGFAVPFDHFSQRIADCARRCGFAYARTSQERYSYAPPKDHFHWGAGAYHVMPGFWDFAEGFFHTEEELALCQIVGHSYDLDTEQMWEPMEALFRRVAEDPNIVSMTHLDLARYLQAMEQAVISEDRVENPSDQTLWFSKNGVIFSLAPSAYL